MANFKVLLWRLGLLVILVFADQELVVAGALSDRLAQFPYWDHKPPVSIARGDLAYPEWMAGTWSVTSTLVEQVAPLAPDIVTPGFEANQQYLNQKVTFQLTTPPHE